LVQSFEQSIDPWQLEELLSHFDLLLADILLLVLRQGRDPLDLSSESIGYELRSKLAADQLNVLMVMVHISDEIGKLFNPSLVLRDQVVSDDVHSLLVQGGEIEVCT